MRPTMTGISFERENATGRDPRSRLILLAVLAILAVVAWGASERAQAQNETVLYSFSGLDGGRPLGGLVMDSAGNLYGTTAIGGTSFQSAYQSSYGTVFELSKTGQETVLYNFTAGVDGAIPRGELLRDSLGNIYGTTSGGGGDFAAAIYELSNSSGSYSENVLHSVGYPWSFLGGVITDAAGNFYGTSYEAGGAGGGLANCNDGCGALYKVDAQGNFSAIYAFKGGTDGAFPWGELVADSAGNLFGTAWAGGAACPEFSEGCGVVFELVNSSGTYTEKVLYTFTGGADGGLPQAGLIMDSSGNLYGTTWAGGSTACGCGTVFELLKNSGYSENVLYSFKSVSDGAYPVAKLAMDSSGNLFGTTENGGSTTGLTIGYGTVYELVNSSGSYTETLLYRFTGGADGSNPEAPVSIGPSGDLYGTTAGGGSANCLGGCGVVFKISLNNTPIGSNVSVALADSVTGASPVSLAFSSITQSGNSTLTTSSAGPAVPKDFKLGTPPTYYNLATTATYSGPVTICINYAGVSFQNPSKLSIWHFDTSINSWTQLATTVNTSTTTACAATPSLSPFALLEPAYAAQIQPPVSSDGSSVFNANRGVVPIKFTLSYGGSATCQLPQATISVMRTAGGTLGAVDQNVYASPADVGSYFRTDSTSCQYVYNLDAGSLGAGTYEVFLSISGVAAGDGILGLQ